MADGLEKHDLSGRIIILRNEMIIPNYSSIWIIYFQMLGILIPNDELTFSRGVGIPPTRWIILYCRASIEKKGSQHISSFSGLIFLLARFVEPAVTGGARSTCFSARRSWMRSKCMRRPRPRSASLRPPWGATGQPWCCEGTVLLFNGCWWEFPSRHI